eukprot:jgi/Mesvir1/16585/Mv25195-RA.1
MALAIGVISMAVSALTSIQNFMQFSKRAERHKQSAHKFAAFFREIDSELTKPRAHRQNPFEFIQICRLTLDNLVARGPAIPGYIVKRYKSMVNDNTEGMSREPHERLHVLVRKDNEAPVPVRIMEKE